MAVDEYVTVGDKFIEQDICEVVAYACKKTQNKVCEEMLLVRTHKEVRQALEICR